MPTLTTTLFKNVSGSPAGGAGGPGPTLMNAIQCDRYAMGILVDWFNYNGTGFRLDYGLTSGVKLSALAVVHTSSQQ